MTSLAKVAKVSGIALLAGLAGGAGWLVLRPPYRLVVRPGLTVEEMRRLSTLPLSAGVPESQAPPLSAEQVQDVFKRTGIVIDGPRRAFVYPRKPRPFLRPFDLEIQGTGIRFEGCRHLWLSAEDRGAGKVLDLNVGISPRALTWDEMKAQVAATERTLTSQGWTAQEDLSPDLVEQALRNVAEGTSDKAAAGSWVGSGMKLSLIVKHNYRDSPARFFGVAHLRPAAPRSAGPVAGEPPGQRQP